MKHMKRLLALALAVMMLLSLAITASAEDAPATTFTIKLTGNDDSPTTGHEYTVYQIFTGKLSDNETVLSDVKYGANYTPGDTTTTTLVPEADLLAITDARAFAAQLYEGHQLEGSFGVLNSGNSWTLANVPAGYYLIVDTTATLPEYHTRSLYMVQVVDDVTMAPKSGVVSVIKKVKDINDSEDAVIDNNEWTDTADHDIGDTVPYQINSRFTGIDKFPDYEVVFTDVMSQGLTYDKNAVITMNYTVIKADGTTATGTKTVTNNFDIVESNYTGDEEAYANGKVYTFTCGDLKEIVKTEGNLATATITIDYTCTLNQNARTGEPGNPNKVNLKYDRDYETDEPGITPWDVNIVFTFKTDVNKVDNENKPLTGAVFTLQKFEAKANGAVTFKGVKGDWKTLELVKNDAGTVFSFTGLDDGEYRITENKAPDGYNAIDPIYFTVTAEHTVDPAALQLTSLNADVVKSDGSAYTEEEKKTGNIASFTVTKNNGNMVIAVENKPGALLPETGGVGTTIFYIAGGVMVLAAVVLLVTKKRMTTAE